MIINSGIKKIIYKEKYPDELARKMLKEAGVVEIHYE
jgi:dCMP deaminase